jgi:TolB-like protein/DNA-binding winged helix-turn-helix (wHTH) protein
MVAGLRAPLRIGEWLVDPETDTITRNGRVHKVEPRMMRLLLLLAESPGAVVNSERMLREIWQGVVVSSSSVYQAISQLRRLLEDTETEPTYIATVPRKGYRLIAPVTPILALPDSTRAAVDADLATGDRTVSTLGETPSSGVRSTQRIVRLGIAVFAALVVLVGVGWLLGHYYFSAARAAAAAGATQAIVVLPFTDMSKDGNDQVLCDGLTEEMSNWLAQVPTLRVVGRTSSFAFRGHRDARDIGRQLHITHVLEGSMRRSGDHMRITVQLIDARSGLHLWSSEYDRQSGDTISLQEDVARSVAESLQIRLTEDTALKFAERRSASAHAYDLYLLALHYQGDRTHESDLKAIDLYHQAIAADPRFALGYVGLAFTTLNEKYLGKLSVEQISAIAEPLLDTAQHLDPRLSEVYAVRGALRQDQLHYEEALADLKRSVELNRNDSLAYGQMGRLLLSMVRPREALEALDRAVTLDPLDFTLHARRCVALMDMANYVPANEACTRARALQGDANFASMVTYWLEWSQGHTVDSLSWIEETQKRLPATFFLYERRADLLLTLGLSASAKRAMEQARLATGQDSAVSLGLGGIAYFDGGVEGLRAHLATLDTTALTGATELIQLASEYSLAEMPADAQRALARARNASDYSDTAINDPWVARWGSSPELEIAMCEWQGGMHESAQEHVQKVLSLLDEAIANGEQRWGIYILKAEALALRGDTRGSMQALERAVDLGWRRSWWADHSPYFAAMRSRTDFRAQIARVDAINRQLRAQTKLTN